MVKSNNTSLTVSNENQCWLGKYLYFCIKMCFINTINNDYQKDILTNYLKHRKSCPWYITDHVSTKQTRTENCFLTNILINNNRCFHYSFHKVTFCGIMANSLNIIIIHILFFYLYSWRENIIAIRTVLTLAITWPTPAEGKEIEQLYLYNKQLNKRSETQNHSLWHTSIYFVICNISVIKRLVFLPNFSLYKYRWTVFIWENQNRNISCQTILMIFEK